ncbi:MAG: type II secretion system protein GspF [Nitrospirae bacterium]|nr:MAG: type II secretion system protein GspF [Nitrospirota bacterium]
MPLFVYEAVDPSGKRIKDKRNAPDIEALKEGLRKEGYLPVKISPYKPGGLSFLKRVNTKDLQVFTDELASLLESGLQIDRAIGVLAEHSEKELLREILNEVNRDIKRGMTLSQALSKHKIFPRLYINMVRAGEAGGILEPVLRRIAAFLETTNTFKEEILSALVYPILLTLVGSGAIAVLMLYVIPKFAIIFEEMGQSLPLPTLILMNLSKTVASYWWVVVGAVVFAVYGLKRYAATEEGRINIDRALIKIPIVSKLQMRIYISRFSRTMGTLLKSGVPILTAIRISREVVGNQLISDQLSVLEEGVRKGRGITAPLRESRVFPEVVLQMVAVGEEAGRLEDTFIKIAERFEAESKAMIKRLISFIEPAIILIMGLVVGFIVVSMLLAIFSINEIPL